MVFLIETLYVFCSSVAALTGSPGQSNYSGANAAMDAWSHARQAGGYPSVSVQWGAWASGGMAARDASIVERWERSGMGVLSALQGMSALQTALQTLHAFAGSRVCPCSELGASPFSWPRLLSRVHSVPEVYSEFHFAVGEGQPLSASSASAPAPGRSGVSTSRSSDDFAAELLLVAKAVIGTDVGLDEPLLDAGLDSLGAVEFRNAVEGRTGVKLPVTAVFDYPTIKAMADFLSSQVGAPPTVKPEAASPFVHAGSALDVDGPRRPVALTSVSGEASTGRVLAPLITDGVRHVPFDKWSLGLQSARFGEDACTFKGCLNGGFAFDCSLFGVQPSESMAADPQQRLLMTNAVIALEGGRVELPTGVAVGISCMDFAKISASVSFGVSAYDSSGQALSVAAGRLSYTFDLKGPSLSIDTACSSSLVAAHFSLSSLHSKASNAALICGVNFILDPASTASFARAGMNAKDGRCKTLDASADGYVRGEAVAVLFVQAAEEPASAQRRASSTLLLGSAVNQDGRSSSLTAPNGPAQQTVIRAALLSSATPPGEISAIQLHGTGTPLGDPIEVRE